MTEAAAGHDNAHPVRHRDRAQQATTTGLPTTAPDPAIATATGRATGPAEPTHSARRYGRRLPPAVRRALPPTPLLLVPLLLL
ncbi:hypothetical protein ACFWIO_23475, partial [Streptomyces diastatochromogenes]